MEEKYILKQTTYEWNKLSSSLFIFPPFLFLPEVAAFGQLVEQQ